MIEKLLEKINIDEAETRVYLSLLESGSTTAGALAKKLGIPRSSLYGYLNDLQSKGLVIQTDVENVKVWLAKDPDELLRVFDEEIDDLEASRFSLEKLVDGLRSTQTTDLVLPKFQHFEGPDGVRFVLKDMLLYKNIQTESFWPIDDMFKILGRDFFEDLNIKRIRANIHVDAIWPHDKKVDIKKNPFLGVGKEHMRELRLAPKEVESSMGYWAYMNKVAFVSSKKEAFGFIVESAELRQMLSAQFRLMWQLSKLVKCNIEDTREFLDKV